MNNISEVYLWRNCTGCRACEQACTQQCITFVNDNEGFIVPKINEDKCIQCGKCKRICPQLSYKNNSENNLIEPQVYAAQVKDNELLLRSSSGGMFSVIAKEILYRGGIVFGCSLNQDNIAQHIWVDNEKDLNLLRGSKYIQSDTNQTYSDVKKFLIEGREVLYIGTPCQISGLKSFLGKNYNNLITIDLICHGVPSPKLFIDYIKYLEMKKGEKVLGYEFRNKEKYGWGMNIKITTKNKIEIISAKRDHYNMAFKNGDIYRECCYTCHYANLNRVGDFTLGDYWGVEKYHSDISASKGVSLLFVNTNRALDLLKIIKKDITLYPSRIDYAINKQGNLQKPTKRSSIRDIIYKNVKNYGYKDGMKKNIKIENFIINAIETSMSPKLKTHIKKLIK